MKITQDQKDWIYSAIEKGKTIAEVKKKLKDSGYNDEETLALLGEFEQMREGYIMPEKRDLKEEAKFEGVVNKFIDESTRSDLSWKQKRSVKKFLSNIEKYRAVLLTSISEYKKEVEYLNKTFETEDQKKSEEQYLKMSMIDSLMDSKEILEIEHPDTGEEINRDNLQSLNSDRLLELMEKNVEALEVTVNGKF